MRQVVDASIIVKLYFAEEHSDAAERRMRDASPALAPDLIWAEIANVIWKRQRRGDLAPQEAARSMELALDLPLIIYESVDLIPDALDLAMKYDRSTYDCLYLALAVRHNCDMITADRRLVNSLQNTPLQKHIAWIG